MAAAFISVQLVLLAFSSGARALQSQEYRLPEDDLYGYTWKNKDARIQEYFRSLGVGSRPGGWEVGGVPPPRHRPHHRPFSYSLQDYGGPRPAPFAVPPSDIRFFQQAPHISDDEMMAGSENGDVVFGRVTSSELEGGRMTSSRTTEGPPTTVATEPTTTEENEEDEDSVSVFKKALVDFNATKEDIIFVAIVAASSAAVVVGLSLLGYGYYRLHKSSKAAADVEYPAYGVTGPNKEATPTGDRRLAHSAQMYHYQLTKQQIIAMESNRSSGERRGSVSEADSDEENEEGDYTVYECPGLAPAGEMEVKNPLFQDDTTPAMNQDPPQDGMPKK